MRRLALLATVAACGDPAPLPCEVEAVVADKCGLCHGDRTDFGAPMSLTTWDDFHAGAPSGDGLVWEVARQRLDDPDNPMPPDGLPPLTAADRAVLDAWFAAGAPARDAGDACPSAAGPPSLVLPPRSGVAKRSGGASRRPTSSLAKRY